MTQSEAIKHLAKWLMVHDADCGMDHDYEATARLEYFKTLRANVAAYISMQNDSAQYFDGHIVPWAVATTHATIAALEIEDHKPKYSDLQGVDK